MEKSRWQEKELVELVELVKLITAECMDRSAFKMNHLAILERCPSVQVQLYFSCTLNFLAIVWACSRFIILN